MENYKKASKLGLRFATSVGSLSVEQLWSLSQTQLTNSIRNLKKSLKKNDDDDLGFLDESTKVDETDQLRFDILKDVYLTRKEELQADRTAKENKERDQKILAIIESKKEGALQEKSVEELEAMLSTK